MDRRTLLAMFLCFVIFLGWQKLYVEPRLPVAQTQTQAQTQTPDQTQTKIDGSDGTRSVDQAVLSRASAIAAQPKHHAQTGKGPEKLSVSTGTGDAELGAEGQFFKGWNLKSYKLDISPAAAAVDMRTVTHQDGEVNLGFDSSTYAYLNDVRGTLIQTAQGAEWNYEDENVKLSRQFLSTGNQPFVDLRVTAEFKKEPPKYAFVSLTSLSQDKDPEAQDRHLVYFTNDSVERVALSGVSLKDVPTGVKYIAATNRYFLFSVVAQEPIMAKGLVQPVGANGGRVSLVYPVQGKTITIPVRVFFGPKELDLLRQVEPTLDHTIDFGWFTIFAYPLLKLLKWFYQFVENYGLAIIFLTLLLKIATYPLTYKSMKSMKKMSKLQPQLAKLREKYKDDKEALNREMLTMMRSHGYNPMAGCLPILIQMPIFFALYRVLYSSIELYHAPFALWIQDLSSRDPFYVTPVLLSVTMFVQQKLTPNTATDPAQAKMMQLMPLIFGAFMLTLPSGLTVYMLVNAIASIVQQLILNKKLDGVATA